MAEGGDRLSLRHKQRAVIEFLTAENVPPIDIHRRLCAVYGEDSVVDVSTVRRWARRSADSEPGRAELRDEARCGRPVTATDERNQQWIDELIQEDRRVSQQYLADSVGISRERAQHIIQLLGYRKVCARWVPRQLTEPMKERRADVCKSLMRQYRRQKDDFLASIVTGDETWVHHYEPESKRASMEFRRKGSPSPRKFKTFPSAGKLMLTVFWDMQGVILIEFLEPGSTVNSDSYVRTLSSLKARIRRVRPDMKTVHLQHDNARPHTSRQTTAHIQQLGFTVLDHPAYSPDLAPSDYHLFPKLKEDLRGQRYQSNEEVKAVVRRWFREQNEHFFGDGIRKLPVRWEKCITREGDYVEK